MLEIDPPLTPIIEEESPIRKPYDAIAMRPGSSLAMRQVSRPSNSLVAMTAATSTNATLSTAPDANAAVTDPTATPATAGSAHSRTISGSAIPLARWAR